MPRNDFYPSQKPYYQEESYIYDEYENYDDYKTSSYSYSKPERKPHHCCPCPCHPWPKPEHKPEHKPHCCCPCHPWPKPEPKPEPKHECKLISAQLSKDNAQKVDEGEAFKFDTFDGVSDNHPNAPLFYHDGTITFKKAGRFIITYGTVVHFKQHNDNEVKLALKLDGEIVGPSISQAELDEGIATLSKTALINVHPGSKLKLVALKNDKEHDNEFKWTNLVIDEKCKMDDKCN